MSLDDVADAPRSPEEGGEADLRRRLVWLMLLRTIVVSVVLGLSLWLLARGQGPAGASVTLWALIAATYVSTIVYALLLRRGMRASRLVWPQLTGDLIITTLLVYVTGAAQSAYTFFFALSIVAAGALQYRRGVVAVGLASLGAMTGLALAGWGRVLPLPVVPWVRPWDQPTTDFVRVLGQNAAAIIAVAVLAYVLGDQLQRQASSLASERRVVADLVTLHQDIVRSLSSGLVTVDRNGRILTANLAAKEILASGATPLESRPIDDVLPGLGQRLAALPAGEAWRRGDVVLSHPEREQVLGMSVSPLRDDREQIAGWVVNFQDLTELRALEQNMRRAERLASLGELTAGIAHEIRNPLAAISGSIELLRQAPQVGDDDRALMDIVTREVDRLNGLIGEMLDYASPRAQQVATLDLRVIVDETLRVFRQDPALSAAAIELAPDAAATVEFEGDPEKLRQVLWNLLRNAGEAAVASGTTGPRVEVSLGADPTSARVIVDDNGAGIPPELVARIFDPFFTTKRRGSGLGLATCQRIVAEHGGTIRVEGRSGGGTRMVVTLPRGAAAPLRARPTTLTGSAGRAPSA